MSFLKYFKYFFIPLSSIKSSMFICISAFYVDLFESWSIPFRISFTASKIHQISPINKFQFSKQPDLNHST